jgi:predicted Zn-dependent protease
MNLVPVQRSWALTLSEEKELGRKILEMIREQMPLVEDGEILTYVRSVGNRIARQVGTTPYQYQFFVVDAPVANAFAVPGGFIFIYRGLIELMASEGELASILSHELAHIQARHIQRRMEEGRLISIAAVAGVIAGALLGMQSGGSQALAMGSLAGARSFELKYSRDNEAEADQLGFRYLCSAGYPPKDMVNVMHSLCQGKWLMGSRIPSYLATHPALDERVHYLNDLVQKEKAQKQKSPTIYVGDFPIMQAALVAEYSDVPIAMDRFEAASKRGEAAATYGLGRLYLRQGKIKESVPYLQAAARQQAASPFILSTLGSAYIQEGKLKDAEKVLRTAILLDPSASIVHLRLALVLQELGQKDEALQHLFQIEDLAPTFPEIDYRLGTLLGQMKREGLAHFYLGRYYEQRRNWDLALFHYKKAKAMLRDAPRKLEELDMLLKAVEKRKKAAFWERDKK